MPTHIDTEQGIAASKQVEASAVATLWLILYMLALGLAILSPSISRMIEFAVLTDYPCRTIFTDGGGRSTVSVTAPSSPTKGLAAPKIKLPPSIV